MNIQNIIIAQGLLRTVEERFNTKKENISSQDSLVPQSHEPDVQEKKFENSTISSEENLMTIVYPPFFPIGNTQDILSIKKVKLLPGEDIESASTNSVNNQKSVQYKRNQNKAANENTGIVQHENSKSIEEMAKNEARSVEHGAKPGVVLDLKV